MNILKVSLLVLSLSVVLGGWYYLEGAAPVMTGYTSKWICSAKFLGGRKVDEIKTNDIDNMIPFSWLQKIRVEGHRVTSKFLLWESSAEYRPGIGCSIDIGTSTLPKSYQNSWNYDRTQSWPDGDQVHLNKDVQKIITDHINHPGPINTGCEARAIVIVHKGRIVGEKYADGFHQNSVLAAWSVTKSLLNTMVGILSYQNKMDIKDTNIVPEWNDNRNNITLDQLLRMSSGLDFEEVYAERKDATQMLFKEYSTGQFAANKTLKYEPDTEWYYSSGTSNIISRYIFQKVGGTFKKNMDFLHRELFSKLHMKSSYTEPDPSGTIVGSSFWWSTARDLARFGLLYANDGIWKGERILPEGWVKYTATPTAGATKGNYGAHWWLNSKPQEWFQDLPSDMYYASGFRGQIVAVFPSSDLVVVRMGHDLTKDVYYLEKLINGVIEALK
eukprot:TRINITY_DN292_c0_g1_i2.p1 TRINITY_DN292_c0_g1~~TRINITY_DN292_c0_g1_i2.p1  ORF type:complete len:443 (+),score=84.56 TRINITY_DN292_c0_g1_i2:18-1346(+)